MKSAAMELGQHNITVNAIIPGLVDTPLTRYEKRLSETIGETGRPPMENPTPEQAWDIRAPDRSAASRLVATRRHFASRCVSRFRRGQPRHRRGI